MSGQKTKVNGVTLDPKTGRLVRKHRFYSVSAQLKARKSKRVKVAKKGTIFL